MAGRHAAGGSRSSGGERSGADDAPAAAWWEELEGSGSAVPASWPLAAPGVPAPGAGDGRRVAPGPAPRVPGWEVERLLGRGGSGEVWRAREVATGDPVALKVLRASVAGDAVARRRLEGEAALLSALDDPHLVRLRGLAQTDEAVPRPVLVLDHAPGASLAALVAERGALDPGEVVTVLVPLAGVLADLHATGVVHGDVSPGNVLFAEDGRPLLADLGTAGLVAAGAAPSPHGGAAVAGDGSPPPTGPDPGDVLEVTPGYADGLRAAGGPATPEGDVHALGACAWHALTALVPGPPSQRPPLVTLRPDVPRALVDLVEDCLEADPARRPDARELARRAWEGVEAEPVRLVPTDPCAPPDEVITHRVRAAARRGSPDPGPEDGLPGGSAGRRRLRAVGRVVGLGRHEQGPEGGSARAARRPSVGTTVLAVVGALATATLLVLLLPLLAPGPLPGGGTTPVAQELPAAPGAGAVPPDVAAEEERAEDEPADEERAEEERAGDDVPGPSNGPAGLLSEVEEEVLRGPDPVPAVRVLAGLRAQGFATRDGTLLARAAVAGSPALEEDLARLADLTRRGARLAELETEVLRSSAAPVAAGGVVVDGEAVVDVVSRTSAHDLVADDGRVLAHVPQGEEVAARLRLVREDGSWRVGEVLPPS